MPKNERPIIDLTQFAKLSEQLSTTWVPLKDGDTLQIEKIYEEDGKQYAKTNGGNFNLQTLLAYSFFEISDAEKAIQNDGIEQVVKVDDGEDVKRSMKCLNTRDDKNIQRVMDFFTEKIGDQIHLPASLKVKMRVTAGANKAILENEDRNAYYKTNGIDTFAKEKNLEMVPVYRRRMNGAGYSPAPVLVFEVPSDTVLEDLKVSETESADAV